MGSLVDQLFYSLHQLNAGQLWLLFLLENLLITFLVILIGEFIRNRKAIFTAISQYSNTDWILCLLTNICNTAITYLGYWLYVNHYIFISFEIGWMILLDFIILFIGMDFLMYMFHITIHKTVLYKAVHQLHHNAIHPKPVDLFLLHPIETFGFGFLWLFLLIIFQFNIYAITIYLMVNVLFGMVGHLGIEPIPNKLQNNTMFKYLGTSSFHHNHHEHINTNFGFYTSLWDRLFGTLKK